MVRRAWGVWGALWACGCAGDPSPRAGHAPPQAVTVARPLAPAPNEAALVECPAVHAAPLRQDADIDPDLRSDCTVAGLGVTPDAPLVLHETPALDRPLAVVARALPMLLTEFREGSDVARVTALGSLRVRGFAQVGTLALSNPNWIWIVRKHVSAWPKSEIRIERYRSGRLDVRVATSFDQPKWLEASLECSELSAGDPLPARAALDPSEPVLPTSDEFVEPVQIPTPVYDAPNGRRLFAYEFTESSSYPDVIERQSGFVRIAERFGNIAVDGWVPAAAVRVPARISGYTRARAPKVRMGRIDLGQFVIARTGADVFVGRPGSLRVAGRLLPNARVRATQSSDEFVRIDPLDGISPARDQGFWVLRSDISQCEVKAPE
jgi:hypothetical protein